MMWPEEPKPAGFQGWITKLLDQPGGPGDRVTAAAKTM
jgi:hypothetical protein